MTSRPRFPKKPKRPIRANEKWAELQNEMIAAVSRMVADAGWEMDEEAETDIANFCIQLTNRQVLVPIGDLDFNFSGKKEQAYMKMLAERRERRKKERDAT